MKIFDKKGWTPIALLCGAIAFLITLGPTMEKGFSTTWIVIQIGITIGVFIAVLVIGPILDRELRKRFRRELEKRLKGEWKE